MIRMEGEVENEGKEALEKEDEDEENVQVIGVEKSEAQLDREAKDILAKKKNFYGKEVIDKFRQLSREPIVFVKAMGINNPIKWTSIIGEAWVNFHDNKIFIPIKIIGQPLKSRSLIVSYNMNLELLVIQKDSIKQHKVETIWPVILYLFNNWIRHQFLLVQIQSVMPDIIASI